MRLYPSLLASDCLVYSVLNPQMRNYCMREDCLPVIPAIGVMMYLLVPIVLIDVKVYVV